MLMEFAATAALTEVLYQEEKNLASDLEQPG
jgi:hypothetical protein